MGQIFLIPVLCYLALVIEFTFFNLFGHWGDPQLLLLVIIFFNLYSGIRFSLWAALCGGVLQDCFGTMPFGTNIFIYVACAYLSTAVRRYCYERGSTVSKLWMVAVVVTARAVGMGVLHRMVFDEVHWAEVWGSLWLPELVATLLVTMPFFVSLQRVMKFMKI